MKTISMRRMMMTGAALVAMSLPLAAQEVLRPVHRSGDTSCCPNCTK